MTKRLRQDHDGQPSISGKTPVERHDRVASGVSERGEVGIAPDIVGIGAELGPLPPLAFQACRFGEKFDPRIAQRVIVDCPSLAHRLGLKWIGFGIRRQPQKSQLCEPAKIAMAIFQQSVEPRPRRVVVFVLAKVQCQPDVDVRKVHSTCPSSPQHLPLRGSPRSVRSLDSTYPVFQSEQAETRPASFQEPAIFPSPRERTQLLLSLLATKARRQKPRRHCVRDRQFP